MWCLLNAPHTLLKSRSAAANEALSSGCSSSLHIYLCLHPPRPSPSPSPSPPFLLLLPLLPPLLLVGCQRMLEDHVRKAVTYTTYYTILYLVYKQSWLGTVVAFARKRLCPSSSLRLPGTAFVYLTTPRASIFGNAVLRWQPCETVVTRRSYAYSVHPNCVRWSSPSAFPL